MEDNSSEMELVVSADVDEFHRVIPHIYTPGHQYYKCCCCVTVTLLVFFLAFLIGYFAHPRTDRCAKPIFSSDDEDDGAAVQTETFLDWSNLTAFIKNTLTTSSIDHSLSQFSSESHEAGSPGDEELGEKVLSRFRDYGVSHWTNELFISVQERPSSGTNRVTFRGATYEESGYLVYSAVGVARGAVLYAYYGQVEDFKWLQKLKLNPEGRIILVRAGKICFAEKVANAARVNASAVLIYPDLADYTLDTDTDLYGHVHLGCGDPYTPGFSSFSRSSVEVPAATTPGLPTIPAQTIRASTAAAIIRNLEGADPPPGWGDGGLPDVMYKLGSNNDIATVEVKNVLNVKRIINVFGVIKGLQDPDRYVVIGAQRDAWGPGYARSTVGTSLLVELARTFSEMIKIGFKPRRSIVFASWSGGEYGAVGATEWLEGYQASLNMKAFSYISLDGVVTGPIFKASASPLMHDLIQNTLKEVSSPKDTCSRNNTPGRNPDAALLEPMRFSDSAYPFLASSGIPSVSFHFSSDTDYPFFSTMLDTRQNLHSKTCSNVLALTKAAGETAGLMALRLVHDHLLRLKVETYSSFIRTRVIKIHKNIHTLQTVQPRITGLSAQGLMSASGSFSRAAGKLTTSIANSDLDDHEQCRIISDRIMGVERDLLGHQLCAESPFRHVILGSGPNTVEGLLTHLAEIKEDSASTDLAQLRSHLAQVSWTIQSCANALAGHIWDIDNET